MKTFIMAIIAIISIAALVYGIIRSRKLKARIAEEKPDKKETAVERLKIVGLYTIALFLAAFAVNFV